MADFVSWATEVTRAKNALANHSWDEYFYSTVENSREMRTSYTQLGNIVKFIQWLEMKASEESVGLCTGEMPTAIGGDW